MTNKVITEKFYEWGQRRNIDVGKVKDCDEGQELFEQFLKELKSKNIPMTQAPKLSEQEQFDIYNNFRLSRHDLIPYEKLDPAILSKFVREYQEKGFTKRHSVKSKRFLIHHCSTFKRNNVIAVSRFSPEDMSDLTDEIRVKYIGMERNTKNSIGRNYTFRISLGGIYPRNDLPLQFTGHLFDRYAERSNLTLNREETIEHFLKTNFTNLYDVGLSIEGNRATMSLTNGICLGTILNNNLLIIFKTYISGDDMGYDQLNKHLHGLNVVMRGCERRDNKMKIKELIHKRELTYKLEQPLRS